WGGSSIKAVFLRGPRRAHGWGDPWTSRHPIVLQELLHNHQNLRLFLPVWHMPAIGNQRRLRWPAHASRNVVRESHGTEFVKFTMNGQHGTDDTRQQIVDRPVAKRR